MSTSSKVVYTAVFGSYDKVLPVNPEWDCDFICFTDNPECVSSGWRIEIVQLDGKTPADANRQFKILPHNYLSNYEYSLYVDANIRIMSDPSPLFDKYLCSSSIAIAKHPFRDCAYAEAQACIDSDLVNKTTVEQQMLRYAAQGFPEKYGLTANGIILRKHFDLNVIELMVYWWEEYFLGGKRDQLSLMYLIWKYGVKIAFMEETAWNKNNFFRLMLHVSQQHKTTTGRFFDYIRCNRNASIFHENAYRAFRLIKKIQSFRRI